MKNEEQSLISFNSNTLSMKLTKRLSDTKSKFKNQINKKYKHHPLYRKFSRKLSSAKSSQNKKTYKLNPEATKQVKDHYKKSLKQEKYQEFEKYDQLLEKETDQKLIMKIVKSFKSKVIKLREYLKSEKTQIIKTFQPNKIQDDKRIQMSKPFSIFFEQIAKKITTESEPEEEQSKTIEKSQKMENQENFSSKEQDNNQQEIEEQQEELSEPSQSNNQKQKEQQQPLNLLLDSDSQNNLSIDFNLEQQENEQSAILYYRGKQNIGNHSSSIIQEQQKIINNQQSEEIYLPSLQNSFSSSSSYTNYDQNLSFFHQFNSNSNQASFEEEEDENTVQLTSFINSNQQQQISLMPPQIGDQDPNQLQSHESFNNSNQNCFLDNYGNINMSQQFEELQQYYSGDFQLEQQNYNSLQYMEGEINQEMYIQDIENLLQ